MRGKREREYRRRETKGELRTEGKLGYYYRRELPIYNWAWRHGRDMAKNKGRTMTVAQQEPGDQETVGPDRGKIARQRTALRATTRRRYYSRQDAKA